LWNFIAIFGRCQCLDLTTATLANSDRLYVHQQNRYALHRVLARLTDYVETQAGSLPFGSVAEFKRADLDERSSLYRSIAERIWNPANLLSGLDA
jgi:hypothetical protein